MTEPRLVGQRLDRGLSRARDLYLCRDLCPGLPRLDLLEVPVVPLGQLPGWWSTRRSATVVTSCP